MSQTLQAIRGMNDILPADAELWEQFEGTVRDWLAAYGYRPIRMPMVEPTPLFSRAIGEVTDIVEKEMYSFEDALNGESLSLPYMDQAASLRARIFGYSDVQMNLVNWYPFVVPFKDGEWMIREPWSHGEYLIYPIADFEIDLKFVNPENAPVVATSGSAEPNG